MNNQSYFNRNTRPSLVIITPHCDKLKFSWSREVNHHLILGGDVLFVSFTWRKLIVGALWGAPTVEYSVNKSMTTWRPTGRPYVVAPSDWEALKGDNHVQIWTNRLPMGNLYSKSNNPTGMDVENLDKVTSAGVAKIKNFLTSTDSHLFWEGLLIL